MSGGSWETYHLGAMYFLKLSYINSYKRMKHCEECKFNALEEPFYFKHFKKLENLCPFFYAGLFSLEKTKR